MKYKIYICHEYYTPSHYTALEYLANANKIKIIYCEPNIFREFIKAIKNKTSRNRLIHNIICTFKLVFTKGDKIVIGMAPYNPFLKYLLIILKGHELYYHSSFTCWDGSRFVHKGSAKDKKIWKDFISNKIKHFFSVSQKTKEEIVKNGFALEENISIVNHSYNIDIMTEESCQKNNNFICVGRLVPQKGIKELLNIFSKNPKINITFVGKGILEDIVKEYASKFSNIKYVGYIKDFSNIILLYKQHSFLIMNSKRTKTWEELFGMAIYEGMACGCVPLAIDHPGPLEIITNNVNGFICEENMIESLINKAASLSNEEYIKMRLNAIKKGRSFHCSNISKKWNYLINEKIK